MENNKKSNLDPLLVFKKYLISKTFKVVEEDDDLATGSDVFDLDYLDGSLNVTLHFPTIDNKTSGITLKKTKQNGDSTKFIVFLFNLLNADKIDKTIVSIKALIEKLIELDARIKELKSADGTNNQFTLKDGYYENAFLKFKIESDLDIEIIRGAEDGSSTKEEIKFSKDNIDAYIKSLDTLTAELGASQKALTPIVTNPDHLSTPAVPVDAQVNLKEQQEKLKQFLDENGFRRTEGPDNIIKYTSNDQCICLNVVLDDINSTIKLTNVDNKTLSEITKDYHSDSKIDTLIEFIKAFLRLQEVCKALEDKNTHVKFFQFTNKNQFHKYNNSFMTLFIGQDLMIYIVETGSVNLPDQEIPFNQNDITGYIKSVNDLISKLEALPDKVKTEHQSSIPPNPVPVLGLNQVPNPAPAPVPVETPKNASLDLCDFLRKNGFKGTDSAFGDYDVYKSSGDFNLKAMIKRTSQTIKFYTGSSSDPILKTADNAKNQEKIKTIKDVQDLIEVLLKLEETFYELNRNYIQNDDEYFKYTRLLNEEIKNKSGFYKNKYMSLTIYNDLSIEIVTSQSALSVDNMNPFNLGYADKNKTFNQYNIKSYINSVNDLIAHLKTFPDKIKKLKEHQKELEDLSNQDESMHESIIENEIENQGTSDDQEQKEKINVKELIQYIEKFNKDNPTLKFARNSAQIYPNLYNTINYSNKNLNLMFSYDDHKDFENLKIYNIKSMVTRPLGLSNIEAFKENLNDRVKANKIESQMIDYLTKELEEEYKFVKQTEESKDVYISKKLQLKFLRVDGLHNYFNIGHYIDIQDSNTIKVEFNYRDVPTNKEVELEELKKIIKGRTNEIESKTNSALNNNSNTNNVGQKPGTSNTGTSTTNNSNTNTGGQQQSTSKTDTKSGKAKYIVPIVCLAATATALIVLQFALALLTLEIGLGVGLGGAFLAVASYFVLKHYEQKDNKTPTVNPNK